MQDYTNEELIFGLDIGTRTVIGVVGYKQDENFIALAYENIEHEDRAMLDGQIHDIKKVCAVVLQVKNNLEKKLGITLKEVAIAAAGRSLSTQIVAVENTYNEIQEFKLQDVHQLELYGVEKAKEEQQKGRTSTDYFCVAYSVINYYLDGYVMTNLEGHKGTTIGAKVLATFLPKQVTDSLYAVTERCGLAVSHLTLEPIAAINAVIPENLRLLNLALVDIGAGTSDIAITRAGSVVAYGMIPIAGDEVTEAIVHHFLVDFNTAEKIKQQLTISEFVQFEDILGLPHEVTSEEVLEVIKPVIKILTESIASKILELNGNQPTNAVFCVGGGSQMISIEGCIAELLQLAKERVAIRSVKSVSHIVDEAELCNTPDMITPLGICLTTMQNKYSQFTLVEVNDIKVQLLNAKKLTILDAIVAAGIEHTSIFPGRGETLMFKLNGERVRIKGTTGTPSQIYLNHKVSGLNDVIKEGDRIIIEEAICGKPGQAYLKDYKNEILEVTVNGEIINLPIMLVNGDTTLEDYQIEMHDEVQVIYPKTLEELLACLKIDDREKFITVNDELVATTNYGLQANDHIVIKSLKKEEVVVEQKEITLDEPPVLQDCTYLVQGEQKSDAQLFIEVSVNGQNIKLPTQEIPYMFASIFDYINFDLTKPQGTIQLKRNGIEAALTDYLCDQDQLEIFWKK